MKAISVDGGWIIAKNFKTLDAGGNSGTLSHFANRTRETYDCWTGERWVGMRALAKKFESEMDAFLYIEEHRDALRQLV